MNQRERRRGRILRAHWPSTCRGR